MIFKKKLSTVTSKESESPAEAPSLPRKSKYAQNKKPSKSLTTGVVWLRFEAAQERHAMVETPSNRYYMTFCGLTYSTRIGVPDERAKKCRNCRRILKATNQ